MNFDFPIEIIRSERTKSASIEIEDGVVKVVVPKNLSNQRIENLVNYRTAWIRKTLKSQNDIFRSKPKEYVNGESFAYLGRNYRLKCLRGAAGHVKLKNGYLNVPVGIGISSPDAEKFIQQSLKQWYQKRALEKLKDKTKRYAKILGVNPRSVKVKEYKARWGSCLSSGDIIYNWRIIIAPHHIVDYIVVHELCHLLEHNHGKRYWRHVESIISNYKQNRQWLKINGETLRI